MSSKVLMGISLAAGLLAVIMVQIYVQGQKGDPVVLFRATADVAAGNPLGTRLETVTLPGDKLFPNILKEAPTGDMREYVSSTPLAVGVEDGELILFRHLEKAVDPGIRASIPAGMKAFSIPVDEAGSVSYLVQPGDLVDVLAAVPDAGPIPGVAGRPSGAPRLDEEGLPAVRPILQAVKVLATGGHHRPREAGEQRRFGSVTLLLTLEEAQKAAYVRDVLQAKMTLALRSEEDLERDPGVRSLQLRDGDFDQIGNRIRAES